MKFSGTLPEQVRRFLDGLGPSAGTVVAVSGGPDSVALLRALALFHPGPLTVAHFNHRLRGPESDADEQFVRELAASLRAEVRCKSCDVHAEADAAKENLEKTARRLRYDWLAQVAVEAGCRWVATGHTADDQAETVLHRLLRGTGLQGLRGIAATRSLASGVEVIRPLLTVSRSAVLQFLESLTQPYRQDSSNAELRYTRNRLRHELLPHLAAQYNPTVAQVLARLAEQAEEVYREVEVLAEQLRAAAERPRAGRLLIFDRAALAQAPLYRVREMFRLAWTREGWPLREMGFDDWARLAAVATGAAAGVDLPGGIQARCRERVVQIGPRE